MKFFDVVLHPFSSAKKALTRRLVIVAARKGVKAGLEYLEKDGIPLAKDWISKPENKERISHIVERAIIYYFNHKKKTVGDTGLSLPPIEGPGSITCDRAGAVTLDDCKNCYGTGSCAYGKSPLSKKTS